MKARITQLLFAAAGLLAATPAAALTIEDFSTPGTSRLGTSWEGFTDRVMGGRSTIDAGFVRDGDATALRMSGTVSLENNGGFVQVRLPLARSGGLDASGYRGVAVVARGVPGSYYLHVRTGATRLPWQYYAAPIPVTREWTRHEIPFSEFNGESIVRGINLQDLRSLAIVAAKDEFQADIQVSLIELY